MIDASLTAAHGETNESSTGTSTFEDERIDTRPRGGVNRPVQKFLEKLGRKMLGSDDPG